MCKSITRLGVTDLGRDWYRFLELDRLEHMAYESSFRECHINEVVRRLTTKCTSLWTRCYSLSADTIEQWPTINGPFVANLQKLFIGEVERRPNGMAHVNVSPFKSLVVLRIEFEIIQVDDTFDKVICTVVSILPLLSD